MGAVSYLNTVPLVWGMLHGEQQSKVDLSFSIPSTCAARVESGAIDIGLVPVAEIARQALAIVADIGIAAIGAVRSILLVSRVPFRQIRRLAVDKSSRTSVELARIILRERYGIEPDLIAEEPSLSEMLAESEAALLIGDPALQIDPEALPYEWLDLGAEWLSLTGLPMVFAAWAGKSTFSASPFSALAADSYEFGRRHLADIVDVEYKRRKISRSLATEYFDRYIKFTLGPDEMRGLEAFYELADLVSDRSVLS